VAKGDLTRARILEQALPLASRLGLDGLTLGVLAEALGLSKSGLYAHFRSKEALLLALLEHTKTRFMVHAASYMEGRARGLSTLRAYLRAWLDWVALPELPAGCPILGASFELEDLEGPPRECILEIQRTSRDALRSMLLAAIEEGELDEAAPVRQIVFELRGMALAFHQELRLMRDPKARALADVAIEGLLSRYPPSRTKRRRGCRAAAR
jgi:AcrR family transcriptional regulator